MRSGKLRHLVTVQRKSLTTDDYGGPVETWADVATARASVEPMQGRELASAQTVNDETTTRITMRYLIGVTTADRITFEGRYYNLQSVIDPELRHRELIIMASDGLNEG